MSKFGQFE